MTVENFFKDIERMQLLFKKLLPREKKIVKYRWGFSFFPKYNLPETGKKLGVSRERIRQIEQRIIKKLNSSLELMKNGERT